MSLLKPVFFGIGLLFLMVSFNAASAQIRVHSSEGVSVIGGTSEDFENAAGKQTGKVWHRVYVPGEGEEKNTNELQGLKDVYLSATGYYHPEQGQNFYATGSYHQDLRLNGRGTTATGKKVTKGHVAVDPSVIPLGTELYSEKYGILKAEDTGGRIKGNRIDIFAGDGEDGLIKARKINGPVKLKVLKWGDKKSSGAAVGKKPDAEQDPDMVPVAKFSSYKDYRSITKRR